MSFFFFFFFHFKVDLFSEGTWYAVKQIGSHKIVFFVDKGVKSTKFIFFLAFTPLLANSADDKLIIFFLLFPENRI